MRIRKHAARLLSAARNFHTTTPASSAPAATIPTATTVVDIIGSSSSSSSALNSQAIGSLSSSSVNVLPDLNLNLNQTVVVCQSNQSPWDVLPPSHPEDYLIQLDHHCHNHNQEGKKEEDDDHGINGRDWSSSSAVVDRTRTTQLKYEVKLEEIDAVIEEKPMKMVASKKKKKKIDAVALVILDDQRNYCKKSDGKGWQCKKEAKHPYTLCDYHLSQIRGYYHGNATHHLPAAPKTIKNSAPPATKKKKTKAAKKIEKDDEPEFYYYFSGFGPWRGKRRDGGVGGERKDAETTTGTVTTTITTTINNAGASSVCGGVRGASCDNVTTGLDPESLDNVEESSSDDIGPARKKKWRKPIKARSLKSLF